MAKEIWEYPAAAADMDFVTADGGMPEGMPRADVNNAARERMRAHRNVYYDNMEWLDIARNPVDGTSFAVSDFSTSIVDIASGATDLTTYFEVGRRVRVFAGGVHFGYFNVSAVSGPSPMRVTLNTDTLPSDTDGIFPFISSQIRAQAFVADPGSDFVVPATKDDAGIAAAYASLTPTGGTILLETGEYLLDADLTFDGAYNVVIEGHGRGATTVKQKDAGNFTQAFSADGLNGGSMTFRGFTYDGNRANQSSGTGNGFLFKRGADHGLVHDVEILRARGAGILISGAAGAPHDIDISDVAMTDIGGSGVLSEDSSDDSHSINVTNLLVDSFGQETSILSKNYGIYCTGKGWTMNGIRCIHMDLGGGFTQVGVAFGERLAADPNPQDGRYGSLSNIYCEGTGTDARGIEVNGEHCSVQGGAIQFTGSTSYGVHISGSGGPRSPKYNIVGGLTIQNANIGIHFGSLASFNHVNDCVVYEATTGVELNAADNNTVSNVDVIGITTATAGFKILGAADSNVLRGCVVSHITGTGFDLDAGSNTKLSKCSVFTVEDGVSCGASSTNTICTGFEANTIAGTAFIAITGSTGNVLKNMTWDGTGVAYLDPDDELKFTNVDGLVSIVSTSDEATTPGNRVMNLLTLSPPPNGNRQYRIDSIFSIEALATGADTCFMEFNLGPLGTAADTALHVLTFKADFNNDLARTAGVHRVMTPIAADIKFSNSMVGGVGTIDQLVASSTVQYIEGT